CEECEVIDFSALERELRGAIESEQRYKRENEAKLRAVSQRVSSYSQFRDLVLTCHLKPLEKKDKEGAPRKQPWNPVAPSNKGCPIAPNILFMQLPCKPSMTDDSRLSITFNTCIVSDGKQEVVNAEQVHTQRRKHRQEVSL
uniref:Dynein attachment factor N-terminal domain-containing protein n=1 Tax=Sparus aurata TaxID=8175 RepID=A0A671WHR9_SPAAU